MEPPKRLNTLVMFFFSIVSKEKANRTLGLRRLVGGSTGPGYSLSHLYLQEKIFHSGEVQTLCLRLLEPIGRISINLSPDKVPNVPH